MPRTLELLRDRLAGHQPTRLFQSRAIEAAVALTLVPTSAGDLELLFIKRAEMAGDPWSGQMALPGGRRSPADRDLLATATRETREEIGIHLSHQLLLGELDEFAPRTPTLPPVVVRPYVFGVPSRPVITESAEVALHIWVPLEQLRRSATTVELEICKVRTTVPAFVVGPYTIWGLTERIVTPLLALAE